uniref:Copia protein n=1 Tax=Tanacetum cinerariifolium TaxID=118510 RepID=A0A6L2MH35_TANCI|nr:copia protein [Tanacetum cinerariifolium]GEV28142.1 copia protein [Tanacetum cinerariifolium]
MDVKKAFLNGILREEVYVNQPDGFVDKENLNHVYKLKKALYGLKQAPRAWYDLLLKFLLSQAFSKGIVDPTLFIRRHKGKIFFCNPVDTLMVEKSKLDEDPQEKAVDPTHNHGMVGTLIIMDTTKAQQIALDDALVALSKHLPKLPGQKFEDPLFEEEILSFNRDLGHTREIKDTQIYGAILPDELINQEMLDSKAYKEYYAVASRAEPPKAKTKYKKKADKPVTPSKSKSAPVAKGTRLKTPTKVTQSGKKRRPASKPKEKGLVVQSEVALTETKQINLATKKSKKDFQMSYTSGLGDGVNIQTKVPDEQQQKVTGTNEGAGVKQRDDEEEEEKEKADDDEVSSDQRVYTPPDHQLTDEEENQEGNDKVKEGEEEQEEEEEEEELYEDLNINLQRSDAGMTDAQQENVQANQVMKDTHVTLTTVCNKDEMIKTRMKSPPLDQTEGGREGDQAKKLSHPKYQHIRKKHGEKGNDLEDQPHHEFNTGYDVVVPITQMAQAAGIQSLFNEFVATPIDFSAFIMHRFKIDNMTQEVLTGPTYDLIKGTCKSVMELEDHLEDVHKATNDRLDWHNPEGKLYPHDLSKPLPLIQNERGHQVISWDYFINNDLGYLKAVSRIWSSEKVFYGKHAYCGTYHWGLKRQKFYGFASNMETSKDVYSKNQIILVTSLKIMKYFGYNHLEEIIVRRQDDQLYKFREGDFKRLRRQDIEDMLLLLVQSKMSNLNLEERYALNVALRMFTRRIFIQERVEDLQLGVESYQKKINLTRPDTCRLDLRRMTPYTAYPDIQGIIYEDEMNRMRIDELHKFSDGTLNHIRIALNDIVTGIEMDYLPKRK